MKKALAPAAKPKHKGKPQGVVDIVPRPFSFCKGSGSPCPITPPELETLPHAGPRCAFLGLRRVGGYRGNEIFFMCEILRTLGSPYNANESFFMSAFFDISGAAKGLSRLGVSPFPLVQGEGPSPGFHRPLRACMRELSRMSRNTTSKAKSPKPDFFRWGEPIWAWKRKTTSHFFHLKIGGILWGRRAAFPFPAERTRGRQSARNYCSPNASRTACTPPAFPPRFPARNTRKTTPSRGRLRPPRSLFSAPEQQASPGEAARPAVPLCAPPGG